MNQEQPQKNGNNLWRRLWLWTQRLVAFVLLGFLLIYLLVQIPAVQNWAVGRLTHSLSNTLGTRVEIDNFRLGFFNRLRMQGVYVEDLNQEPLLEAQRLMARIDLNPFTLLSQGLVVDEIQLTGARLNLRRAADEEFDNLQLLLQLLSPQGTKKKKNSSFNIDLDRLTLQEVRFIKEDLLKGQRMEIGVELGEIVLNELDIPNKRIDARSVFFDKPEIFIDDYPRSPSWNDSLFIKENTDTVPLKLNIQEFDFKDGTFKLHNYRKAPVKLTADDIIDYKHLEVFDIQIQVEGLEMIDLDFKGRVNKMAAKEGSGFVLDELSAKSAVVNSEGVALNDLKIITPYSEIGDTLIFRYGEYMAFTDFTNRVIMDGRLNNSSIALQDIITFAPGLNENPFFDKNRREQMLIDGRFKGTVNNLDGDDLSIRMANGTQLRGSFSSRDLTIKGGQSMNLQLTDLRTNIQTLRDLVPNFSPPDNFNELGNLRFNGRFDGFFVDFVAKGKLRTDIGNATMDMRMDLKRGKELAVYSGNLQLDKFDLGALTGDKNLGEITITSKVSNGVGLSGSAANADLTASISSFTYKGYQYENAQLAGRLQANQFSGDFKIQDDNIDFSFDGLVDLSGDVPVYDFKATVARLDMNQLNFTKKEYILSGFVDLNLRNKKLSNLEGDARLLDFSVETPGKVYRVDSVLINSTFDTSGARRLRIQSDLLDVAADGIFDIEKIVPSVVYYLNKQFPAYADKIGLTPKDTTEYVNQFSYNIFIKNSKDLNELIDPKLGLMEGIRLKGSFDNQANYLKARLQLPYFQYDRMEWSEIDLDFDTEKEEGELDLSIQRTVLNEKTELAPITVLNYINKDTLSFSLNYAADEEEELLANLELDGILFVQDSAHLKLQLEDSRLVILEYPWNINRNNTIVFTRDSMLISDFIVSREDKRVELQSFGKRGLEISMENLDFNAVDEQLNYEPIDFDGSFDIFARSDDVLKLQNLQFSLVSDTLLINEDDFGVFRVDASMANPKEPVYAYATMTRDTAQLVLEGSFNTKEMGSRPELAAGYFDGQLNIQAFPLDIAEYFIGNVVSGTTGGFDARIHVFGMPESPNVEGELAVTAGGITVDYLKTRYTFTGATIDIDNFLFDATGTVLRDKYNHEATIIGGIRHNHLRDFGFNARLNAPRFLALDTKKGDNKLFYGHALGMGEILFTGSFKQPDAYIKAEVGDSTKIVIPVSSERDASKLSFIDFVDKDEERAAEEQEAAKKGKDLKGLSLEMDLTARDEAIMQIIFNEQAGDIIEGQGRGALRISVPRSGDFQMYGDYEIEQGSYLFTLYNVINKNFRVRRGGTISWTGDPFGAEIDLFAEYADLNTPVSNFIQEYLIGAPAEVRDEASTATDVTLDLRLRGDLLRPQISFDINFPNLKGELQTYAQSKLRLLKQDQNELNKQVFGLIIAGQFLPSDLSMQGTDIIYNTVSEFVSNQLSLLLTELFSEFIGEDRAISDIDFDIAYNQYQSSTNFGETENISRGNELSVSLKQNFFNDRLSIQVGGNIDLGGNVQATPNANGGAFVGNDLVFTYFLNSDRSLKLRIYQRLQPDIAGRKLQIGSGLSYRKEFDSFSEFLKSFKKDGKKK